jgi:signal transduction histidine kinase
MSSIIDYEDRQTCVIFVDAGAAVLLEHNKEGFGIKDAVLGTDGSGFEFLHQKAGGSARPASHETIDAKEHYVYQEGHSVFKFAVTNMAGVSAEIMERNIKIENQNKAFSEIAWIQSHKVRGPLTSLMGLINILKMPPIDDSNDENLLELISIAAEDLDKIIHEIVEKSEKVVFDEQ